MIRFDNVSKSYWTWGKQKVILHDASFQVDVGRNLGILAPNGTGKSTLLALMAGLKKPDHGVISRRGRVSWPIGYDGGLQKMLTGAENIGYIARLYDLDPYEMLAFCIDFAELGYYMDMPVYTYSSGMKARLIFSIMISIDFDFYLMDEGVGAGDKYFNDKASQLFAERLEYASLIMVSHSPNLLKQYVSAAAVLRDGQLYLFDSLEEAKELYAYE